jgi:hypothetical protein
VILIAEREILTPGVIDRRVRQPRAVRDMDRFPVAKRSGAIGRPPTLAGRGEIDHADRNRLLVGQRDQRHPLRLLWWVWVAVVSGRDRWRESFIKR